MKKSLLALIPACLLSLGLASCGKKEDEKFEVAVVTDVGQLNDGGFNQGTWEGAKQFAEANGKTYKYYQPANGANATDNDRIAAMRQAIENGAKIIVTPGFLQYAAIQTVAAESPDVKFVFVDGWVDDGLGNNVTAIAYKEQESGYFAGYAAVMDGYTKLGGTFGGGGTNAACNRFAYGYVQGANAAAIAKGLTEDVEIRLSFQYGDSFSASQELQAQISGWYQGGTQVVFSCGGSMLQSVKSAAAEKAGAKIIGVDVDQHGESEQVITSAVKGLTPSVKKVLGQWAENKWDSDLAHQLSVLGAADDATGLPTSTEAWRFSTFTVAQYQTLFEQVKNGNVQIASDTPSNMKNAAVWTTIDVALLKVTIQYE